MSRRRQARLAPVKTPTGQKACRGRFLNVDCRIDIEKGRRTWCGQDCIDACMVQINPGEARRVVGERDKGVCNRCGRDTKLILRIARRATQSYFARQYDSWWDRSPWTHNGPCRHWLVRAGFNPNCARWEVDHIDELADGGAFTLNNLQTLCVPCHKIKTAEQKRLRASRRKGLL